MLCAACSSAAARGRRGAGAAGEGEWGSETHQRWAVERCRWRGRKKLDAVSEASFDPGQEREEEFSSEAGGSRIMDVIEVVLCKLQNLRLFPVDILMGFASIRNK